VITGADVVAEAVSRLIDGLLVETGACVLYVAQALSTLSDNIIGIRNVMIIDS
jgi:hypothetical protein